MRVPSVVNEICSAPLPPVPLSSSVTAIELGLIGIVHVVGRAEDAVGAGADDLDRRGREVGQVDVLVGRDRELDLPPLVSDW